MTTRHIDRIAEDCLWRLDDELGVLPARQRREIMDEVRDHLTERRADMPAETEADLRDILDRLGDPREIADEARRRLGAARRDGRSAGDRRTARHDRRRDRAAMAARRYGHRCPAPLVVTLLDQARKVRGRPPSARHRDRADGSGLSARLGDRPQRAGRPDRRTGPTVRRRWLPGRAAGPQTTTACLGLHSGGPARRRSAGGGRPGAQLPGLLDRPGPVVGASAARSAPRAVSS